MVGRSLQFDRNLRWVLYSLFDPKDIEHFRDEFMELLQPKIEYEENLERWGLERGIDIEREEAINDLREGEIIIAIFGGIGTLLIGNYLGWQFGAIIIAIAIILYTLVVASRIVVMDHLAYSSIRHRNATMNELAKMKTWNEGPLRGRGGLGVVILSLITSRGSMGYELGMSFMDPLSDLYFNYNKNNWKDVTSE